MLVLLSVQYSGHERCKPLLSLIYVRYLTLLEKRRRQHPDLERLGARLYTLQKGRDGLEAGYFRDQQVLVRRI